MPLTDVEVRALVPAERPYKRGAGNGLHVLVMPGGSKLWRYAYRQGGKQHLVALGGYPAVSLVAARRAAALAKLQVIAGDTPTPARPRKKGEPEPAGETFAELAKRWFDLRRPGWEPAYADRVWARVNDDLVAEFGPLRVRSVTRADVLRGLKRITDRGAHEMARRVRGYAEDIFSIAEAEGAIEKNPAIGLVKSLPAPHPVKHRTALPARDLPTFLADLGGYGEETTRLALMFTILTMVRTDETRGAHDGEIENLDGAEPLWRLPPDRMKVTEGRGEHIVPLSPQAVAVVRRARQIRAKPGLLFQADSRGRPISGNRMIYALYSMGYHGKATVHGFRRLASTILNESGLFQPDWIEAQLAHVDPNEVRAIYNGAEYLPQRRKMLGWWGAFIDGQRSIADLL